MASFSFWGTCTTRDINELGGLNFDRSSFVSFISPLSFISPKNNTTESSDLIWGSPWYQRNLMHDLNGNFKEVMASGKGDYLLLNLNTIRYGILYYENKHGQLTSCTNSRPFKKNKSAIVGEDSFTSFVRYNQNGTGIVRAGLKYFSSIINEIYPQDRIILLENYMCERYTAKDGQIKEFDKVKTKRQNDKFSYWNKVFKEYVPRCHVISQEKEYIADENHKWGLGQAHYEKSYYTDMADKISKKFR